MSNEKQPVDVVAPATIKAVLPAVEPAKVGDLNIPPTTTAAQDLVTHGQRQINLIWERMQASIAAAVVGCCVLVSSALSLWALRSDVSEKQLAIAVTAFMLLGNLGSLVIGFYFGRTNHQRTGGVGPGETGR